MPILLHSGAAQSTQVLLLNPCSTFNLPDATVITKAGLLNIKFIIGTRRMKGSKQVKLCTRQYAAIKCFSEMPLFIIYIYSDCQGSLLTHKTHHMGFKRSIGGYQTCYICVP